MFALRTLYAFEDRKTVQSRRFVASNGTVRGSSVKGVRLPRAGKGAECEAVAKYDLDFLRGAIEASQKGDSVESYAEAYEGPVKLVGPKE